MTWKCWTLIAVIAAILVGGLWVMRSQQSAWTMREKELVEDSQRWQHLAGQQSDRAADFAEKANDAQREADTAIAELDARPRRKRPKPTTIKECEHEFDEYDARNELQERALAYTRITNGFLRDTIDEQQGQIVSLGHALTAEQDRADGWKRYSRKGRVKAAFLGIAVGVGGGLVGYGVGVATR